MTYASDDATATLHALVDGTEGCGPAARAARPSDDEELADFLHRVQEEIVEEGRRLLVQRMARR